MLPDASNWRSAAHYDHVEKLTASGLAWEWLRRNEQDPPPANLASAVAYYRYASGSVQP